MAVEKANNKSNSNIFKVSTDSNPASVAGAIAGVIRDHGKAELQAIGAGAINQATKAVAIARGYLAPSGYSIAIVPSFVDLNINGQERTAIRLDIIVI